MGVQMQPTWLSALFVLTIILSLAPATAIDAQALNLERAPRLRLIEEVRIGSASDPSIGFTRVGSPAVDRDGNLYVPELQEAHVRVYSPAGKFLRTIGRKGAGPGELTDLAWVGLVGDTLWVSERIGANRGGCGTKITLFHRNGTFIRTLQYQGQRVVIQNNIGVVSPRWLRVDGRAVSGDVNCFGARDANVPVRPSSTDTARVPRVLFDSQGAVVDTLGWYLVPPIERVPQEFLTIEGRRHPVPVARADPPLTAAVIDGRIVVDRRAPSTAAQSTIRISRTRLTGDTVFSRLLSYTPVRYANEVLDSIANQSVKMPGGLVTVVNGIQQTNTSFANPAAAAAVVRSHMKYPPFLVPVDRISVGEDGSIWLRRDGDDKTNSRWMLLDAQGLPRGFVDFPRNYRIEWSSGDVLWTVATDADDVPWMVRFRIARP